MSLALLGLLLMLVVSAVCSWWLAVRKTTEKPVRAMIFIGYFWLLSFVQIMLAVLVYLAWQHFSPH
jgi:uncharacterized membrane protein YedE/YeeE